MAAKESGPQSISLRRAERSADFKGAYWQRETLRNHVTRATTFGVGNDDYREAVKEGEGGCRSL